MKRVKDGNPFGTESAVESVSSLVFTLVSAAFLGENRRRLEASRVPVYRVKSKNEARYRVEPLVWNQLEALTPEERQLPQFAIPRQWTNSEAPERQLLPQQDDAFSTRWNALMTLTPEERVQELVRDREKFDRTVLVAADPAEKSQLLVGITEMTFLVNRASMNVNKSVLTDADRALVRETTGIIQSVVTLVEESQLSLSLFRKLETLSNGQTLNHIVRVFSVMVSLLVFYNDAHTKGLNQKIRSVFSELYREEYFKRLPHLPASLATSDNLVRLPALSPAQVQIYALGALMHDVGKIVDLEYFEGSGAFDSVRIKQHPILGSGLFQRTYGEKYDAARYIVGDHHNYLFHREGYGLTRWERLQSRRIWPEPVCGVADSLTTFTSGQSLGFLPVELCTLVDIYDALTDPYREYKKPMTGEQTIAFIGEQFLATRKIDPILFDLFIDFLKAMGIELPADAGLQAHYRDHRG